MTKILTFKPIVLPQKNLKRIASASSLATLNDSEHLKFDRNRKIAESVKNQFIQMVTQKNFSMKNAAKAAGISYSTAKKIFTSFRTSLKSSLSKRGLEQTAQGNLPRASYTEITSFNIKAVEISCLIGGRSQEQ